MFNKERATGGTSDYSKRKQDKPILQNRLILFALFGSNGQSFNVSIYT
jgi:hypothetical protein